MGIDTYELTELSEAALEQCNQMKGHFTIKVDPLAPKKLLHKNGFFYTDTLLKPVCKREQFTPYNSNDVQISSKISRGDVIEISNGAYHHGRFHRDFSLNKGAADKRYDNWLGQLYDAGNVWGLLFERELAGFFAYQDDHILLQVTQEKYQGRGLTKYFWSSACESLFKKGYDELTTSISAANLAMVNLVTSLGFRFREAVDVYHKLNKGIV